MPNGPMLPIYLMLYVTKLRSVEKMWRYLICLPLERYETEYSSRYLSSRPSEQTGRKKKPKIFFSFVLRLNNKQKTSILAFDLRQTERPP